MVNRPFGLGDMIQAAIARIDGIDVVQHDYDGGAAVCILAQISQMTSRFRDA